jgi:hypothetical protein
MCRADDFGVVAGVEDSTPIDRRRSYEVAVTPCLIPFGIHDAR